jgi:hypothetical protein
VFSIVEIKKQFLDSVDMAGRVEEEEEEEEKEEEEARSTYLQGSPTVVNASHHY